MKIEKPEWFEGAWYSEGERVSNPFSGESYDLNGPELSMYDFIMGVQMVPNPSDKMINDMHKALSWFRTNNAKAYMVLLD